MRMREKEGGKVREDHSTDKLSSNPCVSCFLNDNFFSSNNYVCVLRFLLFTSMIV